MGMLIISILNDNDAIRLYNIYFKLTCNIVIVVLNIYS
jgi:hypothetical protein